MSTNSAVIKAIFTTPPEVWEAFKVVVPKREWSKTLVALIKDYLERGRREILLKEAEELFEESLQPGTFSGKSGTEFLREYRYSADRK
ncbi:MAG: hypothetical protein Q8P95_00695 [bacterium]|nr:hypothetical protein [bacterium]